jgi:hypothetical protein
VCVCVCVEAQARVPTAEWRKADGMSCQHAWGARVCVCVCTCVSMRIQAQARGPTATWVAQSG